MTRDDWIEIVGTLLLVLILLGAVAAIVVGLGCGGLKAMEPPADPFDAIGKALETEQICTETARLCDECEPEPLPESGISECMLLCLESMQDCIESSKALADSLEPADGGHD